MNSDYAGHKALVFLVLAEKILDVLVLGERELCEGEDWGVELESVQAEDLWCWWLGLHFLLNLLFDRLGLFGDTLLWSDRSF